MSNEKTDIIIESLALLRELLRVSVMNQATALELGWTPDKSAQLERAMCARKKLRTLRMGKHVNINELMEVSGIAGSQVQADISARAARGIETSPAEAQCFYGRYRAAELSRRGYMLTNDGGWVR